MNGKAVFPPRVGIVILHWHNAADTIRCIASIAASDYPACSVLVVDNGSGDGSGEQVCAAAEYPDLALVVNRRNLGYTGGNNVGIRYWLRAGVEYILLLNDDAVLDRHAITAMVTALAGDMTAGAAGPKIYAQEDPARLLTAGGHLDHRYRAVPRGLGQLDTGQFAALAEVSYLSGCALLVRRQVFQAVGLFDPNYFVYHEDVDWCYRVRQAGYRLLLVPDAHVWHPDTRARDDNSAFVSYYIARNRLLFMRKHGVGWTLMARTLAGEARLWLTWSIRPRWHSKRPQAAALSRAIWDFLTGHKGQAKGL
jgi:GT2 family glycosyltransferase